MIGIDCFSPRWIEVDIDAILHNLKEVRRVVNPSAKIMAVVKADAYGCGAPVVSRALVGQGGVEWLAVTTLDEGIELRKNGIEARILVFNPLLENQVNIALDYELTPTINSKEAAWWLVQALRDRGQKVRAHLKVETGMGRSGLFPEDAISLVQELKQQDYLEIEGIYTHFAVSAFRGKRHQRYTQRQFERLLKVIKSLESKGIQIPLRHVCNSAGILAYPHMHLSMVRPGTILYGQYPSSSTTFTKLTLQDPWRFKARILQVQNYPRGSSIGYGRTFVTRRSSRIAVLPVGYADGFNLEPVLRPQSFLDLIKVIAKNILSYIGVALGATRVKVEGSFAPVVGKIAMQTCMIDVTGIPQAKVGSLVEINARRTTMSKRIPRLYIKENQPQLLRTPDGEEYSIREESLPQRGKGF